MVKRAASSGHSDLVPIPINQIIAHLTEVCFEESLLLRYAFRMFAGILRQTYSEKGMIIQHAPPQSRMVGPGHDSWRTGDGPPKSSV